MSKIIKILFLFLTFELVSCWNNNSYILGKWKFNGVGTTDTSLAKDKLLAYGLITISASGQEFTFFENDSFNISKDDKIIVSGIYTISSETKILTLKAGNVEEKYDLVKKNKREIMLKSTKDASVISLKKIRRRERPRSCQLFANILFAFARGEIIKSTSQESRAYTKQKASLS